MATRNLVHFLLVGSTAELNFGFTDQNSISFKDSTKGIDIAIKEKKPGEAFSSSEIRAKMSFEATVDQIKFITGLKINNIVPYGDIKVGLPYEKKGEILIDADGKLTEGQTFWFEWLPTDLQQLIEHAKTQLTKHADRFLKLLRWQQGYYNLPSLDEWSPSLYWRAPHARNYHWVPHAGQTSQLGMTASFGREAEIQKQLKPLWANLDMQEPLGHELLVEAKRIKADNARAALLICCSALEVGVKSHISAMVPKAEWLMFKLPTPPVFKVLKDYLPGLHSTDCPTIDWDKMKDTFKVCQNLIEDRNALTHAGQFVNSQKLDEYLSATSDILYILDFLRGQSWASENISSALAKKLGVNQNRRGDFSIQIRTGPTAP